MRAKPDERVQTARASHPAGERIVGGTGRVLLLKAPLDSWIKAAQGCGTSFRRSCWTVPGPAVEIAEGCWGQIQHLLRCCWTCHRTLKAWLGSPAKRLGSFAAFKLAASGATTPEAGHSQTRSDHQLKAVYQERLHFTGGRMVVALEGGDILSGTEGTVLLGVVPRARIDESIASKSYRCCACCWLEKTEGFSCVCDQTTCFKVRHRGVEGTAGTLWPSGSCCPWLPSGLCALPKMLDLPQGAEGLAWISRKGPAQLLLIPGVQPASIAAAALGDQQALVCLRVTAQQHAAGVQPFDDFTAFQLAASRADPQTAVHTQQLKVAYEERLESTEHLLVLRWLHGQKIPAPSRLPVAWRGIPTPILMFLGDIGVQLPDWHREKLQTARRSFCAFLGLLRWCRSAVSDPSRGAHRAFDYLCQESSGQELLVLLSRLPPELVSKIAVAANLQHDIFQS
ncbi:hypothetical protein WJX84_008724 [Apatococcus fuscideae]|uniref:Uncharacterized protein n=1 Tax=Apatococcus fuscideae TaxID=2026836 RepID=A0AAW1TEG9_9CHLO